MTSHVAAHDASADPSDAGFSGCCGHNIVVRVNDGEGEGSGMNEMSDMRNMVRRI